MAGIQLTLVIGHPLALPPPVQASAAVAPNGPIQWTTAQPTTGSQAPQAPAPVAPPVIS